MRILQHEYAHPTQVTRLRLNLFRYAPSSQQAVAGLLPEQEGYHITEDRVGAGTVVASLGFFVDEREARARFARRAEELERQGWQPATTPTPHPSVPPGGLSISEPEGARAALTGTEPERVAVPGDDTPRPARPV